jgi:hypothetical protein
MYLSHIYHAWLPHPPNLPIIFLMSDGTEVSTARFTSSWRAFGTRRGSTFPAQIAISVPISFLALGSSRAARSDKNLSQVLKNMASRRQKSTVQSRGHHFVSICTTWAQDLRVKNEGLDSRSHQSIRTVVQALFRQRAWPRLWARLEGPRRFGLEPFDHRPSAPPFDILARDVLGTVAALTEMRRSRPGRFAKPFRRCVATVL